MLRLTDLYRQLAERSGRWSLIVGANGRWDGAVVKTCLHCLATGPFARRPAHQESCTLGRVKLSVNDTVSNRALSQSGGVSDKRGKLCTMEPR